MLARQLHWRSRDKSPLTKWRETSTGVCFFQSKDLWKLFPGTLKQKMCPAFSCQVGGDGRSPWSYSRGGPCHPPQYHLRCGLPQCCPGTDVSGPGGRTCKQVASRPAARGVEGWEAVFSKHVQDCAFLGQGVLGSATELIKGQASF